MQWFCGEVHQRNSAWFQKCSSSCSYSSLHIYVIVFDAQRRHLLPEALGSNACPHPNNSKLHAAWLHPAILKASFLLTSAWFYILSPRLANSCAFPNTGRRQCRSLYRDHGDICSENGITKLNQVFTCSQEFN